MPEENNQTAENRHARNHRGNFMSKNVKNKYQRPKVSVDLFIADEDHEDARDIVSRMCWTLIPHATTAQQAGALFASIIGAFAPELLKSMIESLEESGAKINTVSVPSETENAGCKFDLGRSYTFAEHVILIGVSFILPFKHISQQNYARFVNARVKGIAGRLQQFDARIKYPLDLTRAKMVNKMFAGNMEVKRTILEYIFWASDTATGLVQGMARYVYVILAWNELNCIVSINDHLVKSRSPVLKHASVKDEVDNFYKAWNRIDQSPNPPFFPYFCTVAERQLVQRRNFPTLAAVAQEIINKRFKNRYMANNFAGTSSKGGRALVQELVDIHLKYCDTHLISKNSEQIKFLFSEDNYDELLNQEEKDGVKFE